jgi:hypothetical protein
LIKINAKVRRSIIRNRRARVGQAVLAEPHNAVCSTACPRLWGYSRMPLFMYTCPYSGYRVQGFVAEDTSEDGHIYEPVTCPVCHQIHHVNPHTGVVLGDKAAPGSSSK